MEVLTLQVEFHNVTHVTAFMQKKKKGLKRSNKGKERVSDPPSSPHSNLDGCISD